MSEIKEVVVSQTVKVNLGDYQSVDFFVSAKVELSPGDSKAALGPEKIMRQTRMRLEDMLAGDILRHMKTRGKALSLEQVRKRYGLTGVNFG